MRTDWTRGTPPWRLIERHVDWEMEIGSDGQKHWICVFEGGLGEHSRLAVEVPEEVWRAFDGINLNRGDKIRTKVGFSDV